MSQIPYGYCHCGCGQKTELAKNTDNRRGTIKGEPNRFLPNHHLLLQTKYEAVSSRFWGKIDKSGGDDACWNWIAVGSITNKGYGMFSVGQKRYMAHRFAWEITNGAIPDGLWVLHNCPGGDNPLCCNPAHLFLGTHSDNMRDMVAKGRSPRIRIVGEKNGQSKLTVEQVREIKSLLRIGETAKQEIARRFGVSSHTILSISRGKTWGFVEIK